MTTPSTAKSESLRERRYSTPEHDDLQLWLFGEDNQCRVAEMFVNNVIPPKNIENFEEYDRYQTGKYVWDGKTHDGLLDVKRQRTNSTVDEYKGLQISDKETEIPLYSGSYLAGVADCVLTVKYLWTFKIKKETWTICNIPDYILFDTAGNVSKNETNWRKFVRGERYMYIDSKEDEDKVKEAEKNLYDVHRWSNPGNGRLDECKEEKSKNYVVLCEIKPKLNSISSMISQMKIYESNLSKTRKYYDLLHEQYETKITRPIFKAVITTDANTKFDKFLLAEGIRVYRVPEDELPV
jgi:hypothetical protein